MKFLFVLPILLIDTILPVASYNSDGIACESEEFATCAKPTYRRYCNKSIPRNGVDEEVCAFGLVIPYITESGQDHCGYCNMNSLPIEIDSETSGSGKPEAGIDSETSGSGKPEAESPTMALITTRTLAPVVRFPATLAPVVRFPATLAPITTLPPNTVPTLLTSLSPEFYDALNNLVDEIPSSSPSGSSFPSMEPSDYENITETNAIVSRSDDLPSSAPSGSSLPSMEPSSTPSIDKVRIRKFTDAVLSNTDEVPSSAPSGSSLPSMEPSFTPSSIDKVRVRKLTDEFLSNTDEVPSSAPSGSSMPSMKPSSVPSSM